MVEFISVLSLGCFLFSIRHETNRAQLDISDENGKHICCATAECTKDDLQRLYNWISDLESSNFLGAPEIIYVTSDLTLEMAFSDVDDESVTIEIFLKYQEDASRSYIGIRGRCGRDVISEFGKSLVSGIQN